MPQGKDVYADRSPSLRLDDLQPYDPAEEIELSILMSTYHRRTQLARSLECLARQDWRKFEVLIYSDGDDRSLNPIVDQFKPYLRIVLMSGPRRNSISPGHGFSVLQKRAVGEVLALMQPEIMLAPDACRLLYHCHFGDVVLPDENLYRWRIDGLPREGDEPTWVALKTFFLSDKMTKDVDSVDWHSAWPAAQWLPEFDTAGWGLSNKPNAYWSMVTQFPWWFIGSARRDSGIIESIPSFKGHAAIDWYLIDFRRVHGFVEVMPFEPRGYHQDHERFAQIDTSGDDEAIRNAVNSYDRRS